MTSRVLFADTSFKAANLQDEPVFKELASKAEMLYVVPASEDKMCEIAKDLDAMIVGEFPITPRVLDSAPKLKLVAKCGVGYDAINVDYATKKGILVTNVPRVLAGPVAEQAFLLMLSVARRVVMADSFVRSNRWEEFGAQTPCFELSGKTLGIIGYGAIGARIGEMARTAFKMKVLAYDPFISSQRIRELSAEPASLEELLSKSDIVSVNVPLSPATTHLIGEKELRMMKPTAVLINTARGKVVDEKALTKALSSGWISAAGLDVMETEPPDPTNQLLRMSNVTITPHTAAFTAEATRALWLACFGAVLDVLNGERPRPPANILNPSATLAGK